MLKNVDLRCFVEYLHDAINRIILRFPNMQIMLLDDFNYPNIIWWNASSYSSLYSTELNKLLKNERRY